MAKLAIRGLLILMAGAISLALFIAANYYGYAVTKRYEQGLADRLALDISGQVAQLA